MIAVVLTVVVCFTLFLYLRKTCVKSGKIPPGPFQWPFIGNTRLFKDLCKKYGGQHLAFSELCRRYGSDIISLRLGCSKVLVVSGNVGIQTVLDEQIYDGRPWNEFSKIRNMGMKKGITFHDGPEWKKLRTWLIRSFRDIGFGRQAMSNLIKDELVTICNDKLKNAGVVRLKPVIAPAIINVIWILVTGKRFAEDSKVQYFINLMERRAKAFDMCGGILTIFPWIKYLAPNKSGYTLLVTLNNELKHFLTETIKEHKKNYVSGNEADLIGLFLREMKSENGPERTFTDEQLVMILVDLFLAGSNTTASTLDFLFLNMAIHQNVQDKLYNEIHNVIGSDRLPDLSDRPNLPYTQAVLTESQRIWVVTPVIGPRRVLQDTTLLGYSVPKNSTILMNIYSVNMDPNIYPEPHSFKPERFLKNGVYQYDENLILFGKGNRRCPGESIGKSALFVIFVGILQRFQILPVSNENPPKLEAIPGITLSPKPYEVLLVPRKRS